MLVLTPTVHGTYTMYINYCMSFVWDNYEVIIFNIFFQSI